MGLLTLDAKAVGLRGRYLLKRSLDQVGRKHVARKTKQIDLISFIIGGNQG
jgi:hypothetical protein